MFSSAVVFTAALGLAQAITINTPAEGAMWQNGQASQQVSWTSVSSDPTSFAIQLSNQQGFMSSSLVTLTANQSTGTLGSTQSATVTYPDGAWPTGHGFQINFITSATNQSPAILAQSNMFNVTTGGSTSGSSTSSASAAAGNTPTTLSQTRAATTTADSMTSTSAASGSEASGGLPNQDTSSKTGAAFQTLGQPSALVSLVLGAAGLMSVML